MIQLTRERTAAAIPPGLRGQARVKNEHALLKGKRDGKIEFDPKKWKAAKE
ncbi:MAG: hypothetical protein HY721_22810 [Planctomycetes bacterium]|nr:hypothetical protein [Planctomycetota bacterium]